MYLGTCFGVQRSNIDNKNTIYSLSRLTKKDQGKYDKRIIIKTIREISCNSSTLKMRQDDINFKKST
jgi:hypothetical protein